VKYTKFMIKINLSMLAIACAYILVFHTEWVVTGSPAEAEGYSSRDEVHDTELVCPDGYYRIGEQQDEPVCKEEPTGCPYADSIPADSIKCVQPETPPAEQPKPETTAVESAVDIAETIGK
jgi:hypothetical protein